MTGLREGMVLRSAKTGHEYEVTEVGATLVHVTTLPALPRAELERDIADGNVEVVEA